MLLYLGRTAAIVPEAVAVIWVCLFNQNILDGAVVEASALAQAVTVMPHTLQQLRMPDNAMAYVLILRTR